LGFKALPTLEFDPSKQFSQNNKLQTFNILLLPIKTTIRVSGKVFLVRPGPTLSAAPTLPLTVTSNLKPQTIIVNGTLKSKLKTQNATFPQKP